MKKTVKKSVSWGKVAAGVAGAAALAGAAYFLSKPKNRKKVAAWTAKAKKEMHDAVKKLPAVSKATYHTAVDAVAKKYQMAKGVEERELAMLVKEAKAHWPKIEAAMKKAATQAKTKAKKAVKKVSASVKKSAKPSTRK